MITEAIAIGITAGIVQAIKTTEIVPSRFLPLLSLLVGVTITYGFEQVPASILQGLLVGLAASGLYSQVKTVKNG